MKLKIDVQKIFEKISKLENYSNNNIFEIFENKRGKGFYRV